MSRITDVSSRLGEYMLKGYVLTDEGCPICSIPMVRSPGQSSERPFCVQCHSTGTTPPAVVNSASHTSSTTSASSEGFSRVSTPPTEVSDALSSPTFAPPPNPQEVMHRRAQSDMASSEIGKRMLRGWAMLAEECPNEYCYGIPLVRPPKAGGGKDPRKECVVCSRVYIHERDAHGLDRLVPLQVPDITSASTSSQNVASRVGTTTPTVSAVPAVPGRSEFGHHDGFKPPRDSQVLVFETPSVRDIERELQISSSSSPSTIVTTLQESCKSLEHTLHILTARLAVLSNRVPVDYITVGDLAHSMEQVTNALRTMTSMHLQETTKHVNSHH